jgi:hypothetical protein
VRSGRRRGLKSRGNSQLSRILLPAGGICVIIHVLFPSQESPMAKLEDAVPQPPAQPEKCAGSQIVTGATSLTIEPCYSSCGK